MFGVKSDNSLSATEYESHPGLDPFAPPADFEHGAEFSTDSPRPLPPFARQSRFVRTRQATVRNLMMVGSACWVTHSIPFVEKLSWYLLPLAYLNWIGSGLVALAIFYWFRNLSTIGLIDYVRRGIPLTGRVRHVGITAAGTHEAPIGRYVGEVEFRNPETGRMQMMTVSSPDTFAMKDLPKMGPGVVPGNYVTLVYLPDRLEKTLQLYGWLGLNPELDLIRKNGRPLNPMSPVKALTLVIAVTAIGWMLLAFLYVMGLYTPLDDENMYPVVIAVALAFVPSLIVILRRVDRNGATRFAVVKRYLFAIFLSFILAAMCGFLSAGFLNGFFDRSPTHLEPVKIVQLWNQTTEFVLRTYELEYHAYPAGQTHKKMVTVETMSLFQPGSLGVIDVGSGWLGMRWLRNFYPIAWQNVMAGHDEKIPGEITFRMPNEVQPRRIAPQVLMAEKSYVAPPEAMVPELRAQMVAHLTNNLKAIVNEVKKP